MKRYARRLILGFAVLGFTLTSTGATAQNDPVFSPEDQPFGLSYSDWAAAWWTWALSQKASQNPILDETGIRCANLQVGPVWFLAGFGGPGGTVTRRCTVPPNTGLLFPVVNFVNCGIPAIDPPEELTEEFVRAQSAFVPGGASGLNATIDGISVPDIQGRYFEQSTLFEVFLPANNLFGVRPNTLARPCADSGYYLMVRPLPLGEHTIKFGGSLSRVDPPLDFSIDVTYHITVSE